MLCKKCGQEIPDQSPFCLHCAASQAEVPTSASSKKKSSPASIIIVLAVAALGFLLGKLLIAPSLSGDQNGSTTPQIATGGTSVTQPSVSNISYDSIFSDRYIVVAPPFFMTGQSASFAIVDTTDDGRELVIKEDYGYEDDIICYFTETYYYSIQGMSDEDVTLLEANFKQAFTSYEAMSCCNVTYTRLNSYYLIQLEYSSINESSALAELYANGITSSTYPLSMEATERSLLADGYIKR